MAGEFIMHCIRIRHPACACRWKSPETPDRGQNLCLIGTVRDFHSFHGCILRTVSDYKEARSPRKVITRLTIFLPSGQRLIEVINNDYEYDVGVLTYTTANGTVHCTNLPFAIEEDVPEEQKSAFEPKWTG